MFSTIGNDQLTASASSDMCKSSSPSSVWSVHGLQQSLLPESWRPSSWSIINIAIGRIASTEVNVDEALQTGKDQIEHSKLGDPKHSTAIFPDKWKHTKRSSQLETLLWLIRKLSMLWLIGLFISNRPLDFNAILASELSAYPPLMFDPTGQSTLEKFLQVGIPTSAIE